MEEFNNIDFGLWQIIRNTYRIMDKARKKELFRQGLSIRNSGIIHTILRLGKKATPVEIAKQLSIEQHTVSEQLVRMEREGLIKKVKDLKWKNLIRVELTEKGYEVSTKLSKRESIYHIMEALTLEERKELWVLLAKLRDKTMEYLDLENIDPYPPSEPPEIEKPRTEVSPFYNTTLTNQ